MHLWLFPVVVCTQEEKQLFKGCINKYNKCIKAYAIRFLCFVSKIMANLKIVNLAGHTEI